VGKGILNTSALSVKIDPLAEWPEIFDEAWRVNRDYFYDPGMHGVDWPAMKAKYAKFLPDLACRSDLNRIIQWMCRKFNVGTLVGKRTWGGLVGILGFPEFLDGGSVTAPNLAIWTKDGFVVENVGVAPDIEVEQWPADVIAGKDLQLEKAIEVAMKELAKNPVEAPVRPPYPTKMKK
jgi:hypothetical protein